MTTNFNKWITKVLSPCCVVFSTQSAKIALIKNNLTPAQFLRPFGDFTNVDIVIENKKENVIINDMKLEFYDATSYSQVMKESVNSFIFNGLINYEKIPNWKIGQKENYEMPWYEEFEQIIFECMKFNECELYQQPLLNIVFLTPSDAINCINQIKNKENPSLISERIYFDNIVNLAIVLNDYSDNTNFASSATLDSLLSKYKEYYYNYSFFSIDINTKKEEQCEDIWEHYLNKAELYSQDKILSYKRGEFISQKTREAFHLLFVTFFNDFVVKKVQKLIDGLDKEIDKTRGFSGIFSKIKGDKREYNRYYDMEDLSQFEKKLYLLSTLQFYFRDYENAYNNLKNLLGMTKGTKQESYIKQLLIICHFLKSHTKKSVDYTGAFNDFINQNNYHYALRALLIMIRMYEHMGRLNEAQSIILKANNQFEKIFTFSSSLMLEKQSYYYLMQSQRRKFLMNIIISGLTYKQIDKSLSAYALNDLGYIYDFVMKEEKFSFKLLKEYLSNEMGSLCDELNYYDGGINLYKNCIEISKNSYDDVSLYMKSLIDMISKSKEKIALSSFNIPEIDNSSVIIIEDQDNAISQIHNKDNLCNFSKIFEKYKNVYKNMKHTSLSSNDIAQLKFCDSIVNEKQISNFYIKRNYIVNVNNDVYVSFTMRNPLNINIEISSLSLIIDTKDNSLYEISAQDITLRRRQSKQIKIKVHMKSKGKLIIKGVSMKLFNIANIVHMFNYKKTNLLYNYRIKRKSENIRQNRISSIASSNIVKKQKEDFSFDILDNDTNIVIDFPQGKEITVYQYQIFMFRIVIKNNSKFNINKYSIFISDNNDTTHNEDVLCDFIHIVNDAKKENKISVPMIPKRTGEIEVKMIIKFEEASRFKEIEVKRFIIQFHVIPSLMLTVKDNVVEYNEQENKIMNVINIKGNLVDLIKMSGLKISNDIILNRKKYPYVNSKGWMAINNGNNDKMYNTITTKGKIISNEENDNDLLNQLENLVSINKDEIINYDDIIKVFISKLSQNFYYIPFSFNINDTVVQCLYLNSLSHQPPELTYAFVLKIISQNITIAPSVEKIDSLYSMVNLNVKILSSNLLHVIKLIKVTSNEAQNDFDWIGSTEWKVDMSSDAQSEKEFSYITTLKGNYNINHLTFKVYLRCSNSDKKCYSYNNIPNKINYSIQ